MSFEDLESTLEEILFSFYLCTFGQRIMSTLCLLLLLLSRSLFSF